MKNSFNSIVFAFCIIIILFVASLLLTGCNSNDEPKIKDKTTTVILYVDSHKEDMMFLGGWCECLRVKEENDTEWSKHEGIMGFEYEKGYQYQLKVEKTILSNPPADSSCVEYRLIEVISKKFKGFNISFQYLIDADNVESILSHLLAAKEEMSNCFYLLYDGYLKNHKAAILEFIDGNGKSISKYAIEQRKTDTIDHKYYRLLPEGQIVWYGDWILHESIEDQGVESFFVILEKISGNIVRSDQPLYLRHWIYKDMTNFYQQLYPEANVRSVIVVQENEYK